MNWIFCIMFTINRKLLQPAAVFTCNFLKSKKKMFQIVSICIKLFVLFDCIIRSHPITTNQIPALILAEKIWKGKRWSDWSGLPIATNQNSGFFLPGKKMIPELWLLWATSLFFLFQFWFLRPNLTNFSSNVTRRTYSLKEYISPHSCEFGKVELISRWPSKKLL